MILAAHQPNHLPWLGYFHKAALSDRFIHLDHVQFEKQNFQSRTRVKVSTGAHWLIVPLARGPRAERIDEKRIVDDGWRQRAWLTIQTAYRRAPHFRRYAEALEDAYRRPWDKLVDLNLHLISLCFDWLDIHPQTLRSSPLAIREKKSGLVAEMCRAAGARAYLSGSGGSRDYLDVERLESEGVRVVWQKFVHPVYPQLHGGFLPNLSVLDLLCNCGPASRRILVGSFGIRPDGAPLRTADLDEERGSHDERAVAPGGCG